MDLEKMFISLEDLTQTDGSVFDGSEPIRSNASTASYRCKVYRAHLAQGAASQYIVPLFLARQKNGGERRHA